MTARDGGLHTAIAAPITSALDAITANITA